jgi:hypothetical protein
MRRTSLAVALCAAGGAVGAQAVLEAPSGASVTLYEVVLEEEAERARFLFLAPGIAPEAGAGLTFEAVMGDFPWLCERVILPALAENDWRASQVVIALSDRQIAFGERDTDAVQFFEAFAVEDGACVLEVF